ncbi:hypothetical protein EON81_18940 [bacterium]|nr:MAG: hypothetical protein EON81_18940 [bacterium]
MWIETRPGVPYFVTEAGEAWTPIGQNEAISWAEFEGLGGRRDPEAVERYLRWNKEHGVTCLRFMLEYAQGEEHYFENPVGTFRPEMVRLWDDLFAMCERIGLHILLTPVDTFWMRVRWEKHPYYQANGGPAATMGEWLTSPKMREAIKARLAFVSDRWGGSPALFAYDLWNEIHPAHGEGDVATFAPFLEDVGSWLRAYEIHRHGRAHLQTVSIFGPELLEHPGAVEPIFRHPVLDFANTHLYEFGTIDDPADTVAPALAVGRLMRTALAETTPGRPVFDSEHGPIHNFLDKKITLPAEFDDEYFRHMQWAHLASGGAGGGMRWPNRDPHTLTPGMRVSQQGLSTFLPLIDWTLFHRRNLNEEIEVSDARVVRFGCGDERQAVVWLLRRDAIDAEGRLAPSEPLSVDVTVPGLAPGRYRITGFSTSRGEVLGHEEIEGQSEGLRFEVRLTDGDLALAIQKNDS